MPAFARTIGIDYSGAETPTASLKGLRVYLADGDELPVEVPPPSSPRKYWTRKGIAEWLVEPIRITLAARTTGPGTRCRVLASPLGTSAALLGAAHLATERLFADPSRPGETTDRTRPSARTSAR